MPDGFWSGFGAALLVYVLGAGACLLVFRRLLRRAADVQLWVVEFAGCENTHPVDEDIPGELVTDTAGVTWHKWSEALPGGHTVTHRRRVA